MAGSLQTWQEVCKPGRKSANLAGSLQTWQEICSTCQWHLYAHLGRQSALRTSSGRNLRRFIWNRVSKVPTLSGDTLNDLAEICEVHLEPCFESSNSER